MDGVEPAWDGLTIELTEYRGYGRKPQSSTTVHPGGPVTYPELVIDPINQDRELYANFRDGTAEGREEVGLVGEDARVDGEGTEAELAIPVATDFEAELGVGVLKEVDNDAVLEGVETDDSGKSGPEGSGITDDGTPAGDSGSGTSSCSPSRLCCDRDWAFSTRCFFHACSTSFVTRRFHISVDSVTGRSGTR